jgi:hypothetical protein
MSNTLPVSDPRSKDFPRSFRVKELAVDLSLAVGKTKPQTLEDWREINPLRSLFDDPTGTPTSVRFRILGYPDYELRSEIISPTESKTRIVFIGNGEVEEVF